MPIAKNNNYKKKVDNLMYENESGIMDNLK
jgi:hypothetical protein